MKHYAILLAGILFWASLPLLHAQEKVFLEVKDNRNGTLKEVFEPGITSFLEKQGYQVVTEKDGIPLELLISISATAGPCNNGFCFAYSAITTSLKDLVTGETILQRTDPRVKGGSSTMDAAYVNSARNGLKSVSDILALKLAERKEREQQPAKTAAAKPEISDVDTAIPSTSLKSPDVYALVIGNEDYSSFQPGLNTEVNVDFAAADARLFATYLQKLYGIPEENVSLLVNARAMEIRRELKRLNLMAASKGQRAELIFFFAGHGLPDEKTKEPCLIPVDVSGSDLEYAVPLKEVYATLTEHPVQKITVFLDACFSGGARNSPLLAVRGVKIKPAGVTLEGRMVVLTSSTGEQPSLSYKERSHGLFTYYILKLLKEKKGGVTLSQLGDYTREKVSESAIRLYNREQTPTVLVSPEAEKEWQNWKIVGF